MRPSDIATQLQQALGGAAIIRRYSPSVYTVEAMDGSGITALVDGSMSAITIYHDRRADVWQYALAEVEAAARCIAAIRQEERYD